MQPLGEALQQQEDEQVQALWEQARQARTTSPTASESKQDQIDRLSIELDGVLARLRRGSVPMEEQERKRKGDVYREVKVGAVFEATRGPERSGLAPGVFVDQAGQKYYVARRSKAEDFGKLLYVLAVTYGLQRAHQLVVLGVGAVWIWRLVAEHFPKAVQIVDIWLPPEPGTSRSVPDIERDYFIGNAARMRYPAFRAQGMQVGSGIAEAACKTVVSTRAKRTGMRWTPEGLDAVLAVRTAVLNDTFDAFCEQHSLLVA